MRYLHSKYVFTLSLIEYFAIERLARVGTLQLTTRASIVAILETRGSHTSRNLVRIEPGTEIDIVGRLTSWLRV